jgi:hypothetical protein
MRWQWGGHVHLVGGKGSKEDPHHCIEASRSW